MTTIQILGIVVTVVLTANFLLYLRSGNIKRDYACLRVLRKWKWIPAILESWLVLVAVIAVALFLIKIWPQGMGWSWLKLVATPEEGPTAGKNVLMSGLTIPGFAWLFLVLFGVNVPRLALNEEYAFRKGVKKPPEIAVSSIKFGLMHCIVGVPIGFGLALSIAGLWFSMQYLIGGVRRSGAYHSIHNWTLLLMAALWLLGIL